MLMNILRIYQGLVMKVSLKTRLVLVLLIASSSTFIMVGIVSFKNIYTEQENRTKSLIQTNLNNTRTNIEDTLESLGNISRQFAYENSIMVDNGFGKDLKKYIDFLNDNYASYSDEQTLDVVSSLELIKRKVALINTSNPIVGLTIFYRQGAPKHILYSDSNTLEEKLEKYFMPEISKTEFVVLNGIHQSLSDSNGYVLSVSRRVEVPQMKDIYVYLETNAGWYNKLFEKDRYALNPLFLMTDRENRIIFSENAGLFPLNTLLKTEIAPNGLTTYGDYYVFSSAGEAGWSITEAIEKKNYDREAIKWLQHFIFVGFVSLGIVMLMVMLIWRTVYRPILIFKREIRLMADNMLEPRVRRTRVKEFDELFLDFYEMKLKIIQLLKQIEFKERAQKELEIEKLLIQINPHFIHNTLNSIQWMAKLNHQKEIERMISIFTRVLNYNLGKKSIIVTVEEELKALYDYIDLQKIRYQFILDADFKVDEALLKLQIPRFIMQPLVENAIYHGMKEEGMHIGLVIMPAGEGMFMISVKDSGEGMDTEQINRLLNEEKKWDRHTGFGIGLKYVDRLLKFYYGEEYGVQIESEKGKGTNVFMQLPVKLKESSYD